MSSGINFSALQTASSAAKTDTILLRLDNALSGADGFAQIPFNNFEKSTSVYSTVQSNSAAWNVDNTIDLGMRALSSTWQNTTTVVQSNSAAWNVDSTTDTGVRALTSTWQNTTTVVQSNSAAWSSGGSSITTPKVFHVAATGNDTTGDGSLGAPFLTVDKALSTGVTAVGINGIFVVRMGVGLFASYRASTLDWPGAVTLAGEGPDATQLIFYCNRDAVLRIASHSVYIVSATGIGPSQATPSQAGPGDPGIPGSDGTNGPTIVIIDGIGSDATSQGGDGTNGGQGGDYVGEGGTGTDGGQGGAGGVGGQVILINSRFTGQVGALAGNPGSGGAGGIGDTAFGGFDGNYGSSGNPGSLGAVILFHSHAGYVTADQLYWGCSSVYDMTNVTNLGSDYGGNGQMPYPSF